MNKIPSEIHDILETLSPQHQRLFACDCAEHVLSYFERFQPLDTRPRKAIGVARQYALGKASPEELDAARADAEGAAWDAGEMAWDAAKSAATHPQLEDAAAASAAATAEGCSLAKLEDAVEAAANTAIEVVVIAAVGVEAADAVWRGDDALLAATILQRYREAEAQERTWQLGQVRRYIT
jgi:hypothetical protein